MKVGSVKIGLSVLWIVAVAVPIFAYVYSQSQTYTKQIPVGIVVKVRTPALFGVYWDYECTEPVTSIDFGKIFPPTTNMSLGKTIYIRNEQPSERIWVYWNSTLPNVTTYIREAISPISNGTMIEPDMIQWMAYNIVILANIPVGTYSWTFTIWADYMG